LYHRLDLYRIQIPPLRERREDIIQLAELIVARLSQRHRLPEKKITAAGRQKLLAHPWPGNVRELAHELERAIVFEEGGQLSFPQLIAGSENVTGAQAQGDAWFNEGYVFPPEGFQLEEAINRLIQHALKQTDNNVSAAARLLGVSRDYIRYRLSGQKPAGD
jgi:two-component system, NtrC family, response regulator AtoC